MRTKTNPSDFLSLVKVIHPDAHAVGAIAGEEVDTFGFEHYAICINLGTIGTSVDFQLQHADDDGTGSPGTFADMAAAYDIAQQSTDDSIVKIEIDLYGTKRHIKLNATVNTSAADFGASGALLNPSDTEDLPAKSTWELVAVTT